MKKETKVRAIEMRRRGLSYTDIINELLKENIKVSKGSLNNWLSGIELTDAQKAALFTRTASARNEEQL